MLAVVTSFVRAADHIREPKRKALFEYAERMLGEPAKEVKEERFALRCFGGGVSPIGLGLREAARYCNRGNGDGWRDRSVRCRALFHGDVG